MPTIDQVITWRPRGGYNPTSPYDGNNSDRIFRGKNMILRGAGETVYLETWQGVTAFGDASDPEPVALTGTLSGTGGSSAITGVGTLFTQELIPSQWVLIEDDIYNVYAINSDTSLVLSEGLVATVASVTGYRPQIIVEVDNIRGNLIRGSIIRFPNGNFLTVGDGVVRFNGAVLSTSVTASKRVTLGLFDPATSTNLNNGYTPYPLGMTVPAAPTLARTTGGTKSMQPGIYSVCITPVRVSTEGYNNPSPKVEVTLTAVNDRIQITFPAMDTASGQDAWDVYVSLFADENSGVQGPWYYYLRVTTAMVSSAGGNYTIEYNDGDVTSRLLTFNNDPPPDAIFVATLQGLPILLSCNGKGRLLVGTAATTATVATVAGTGTTWLTDIQRGQIIYIDGRVYRVTAIASNTSMTVDPAPRSTANPVNVSLADTAPGPVIRPAKPAINGNNVEAFPTEFKVAVDPPENIVAWCRGADGRIFVGTENYIHLVSSTGNPDLPVTVRPYWRAGVRNTQALLFVNDTLFAYTVNGPTRSVGGGDESIAEHAFAAPVTAVFRNWVPERVRIGYDPKNEAVCFFHATAGSGDDPRLTECLMYMLRLGAWSPTVIIEHASENRTMTGVATVAGKMIPLFSGQNYQWDVGTDPIIAYVATAFLDAGDPGTDKTITGMQMTGYSQTAAAAGIWAAEAGEDVPITDLENGASPDSGALSFVQGSFVRPSFLERTNVARARLFAGRVDINWLGTGTLGRLDELVLRGNVTERRF